MNFVEAVVSVLSHPARFRGRASRSEFWWFFLFVAVLVLVPALALPGTYVADIVVIVLIVPNLSVSVRRLHDTGRSGWWMFIGFIPIVGSIWLFVLQVTAGDVGANAYGPDPNATTWGGGVASHL